MVSLEGAGLDTRMGRTGGDAGEGELAGGVNKLAMIGFCESVVFSDDDDNDGDDDADDVDDGGGVRDPADEDLDPFDSERDEDEDEEEEGEGSLFTCDGKIRCEYDLLSVEFLCLLEEIASETAVLSLFSFLHFLDFRLSFQAERLSLVSFMIFGGVSAAARSVTSRFFR
jgi:hypothetical protein